MTLDFQDFQKQDIKFDISELQKAYKEIVKIKNIDGPEGITNFGAISLTQIPGDPESIKGHKARGVFWTYPDSSGKEQVEMKKLMKLLTQNLLMITKILILKKCSIYCLPNINLEELEFY